MRVYKRRDKFRFLIKKGVVGRNKIVRDLFACVIRKFNFYEISSVKFQRKQKIFFYPLDVVYEPTTEGENIICYYTDDLALAYRTHYLRKVKETDVISNLVYRQCYYCDHFFIRKSVLEKHIKLCSSVAGVAYKFNNRKIVSFQDNFKFMGDLPFTVYFDFETTTGAINDKIMVVISCCQIFAFNPSLNLQKIVIFRSFQQNVEEITSLDHFSQEHIPFFDQVTTAQMKDAATKVFNIEKTTVLSELFTIELKFAIETLVNWFNSIIKQKFIQLNDFQKQAFLEKDRLNLSKTICCISGFMLSLSSREGPEQTLNLTTRIDFIAQQEYLFMKNIYSQEYIENTGNLRLVKVCMVRLSIF